MNTDLNKSGSLGHFRRLFSQLPAPVPADLTFESAFAGPGWLRAVAPAGLGFLGMPGWCGKRFLPAGEGINLLKGRKGVRPAFPFRWSLVPSLLDGKPVLQIRYLPDSHWPWPGVIDELRLLEPNTWLGMTYLENPAWLRFPLPFVLHHPQPLHQPHV